MKDRGCLWVEGSECSKPVLWVDHAWQVRLWVLDPVAFLLGEAQFDEGQDMRHLPIQRA